MAPPKVDRPPQILLSGNRSMKYCNFIDFILNRLPAYRHSRDVSFPDALTASFQWIQTGSLRCARLHILSQNL